MGHFLYRLRLGSASLRVLRTENPATGSTWAAIAMSLTGFLYRCAILIRPKKEKDYVDLSSLQAPGNNRVAMHTGWCRCGASGRGLLALVYHSTPETSQGTEVFVSGR